MIERLKKCLCDSEKYFIQVALIGSTGVNRTLKVRMSELAKMVNVNRAYAKSALDKLEIAGYIKTEKDGYYTIIRITKIYYIKQIFE